MLRMFIQATSYSTSTAEKYLGSQLALYVQKNAGNYTILRNLPERDNFRKHFKQTSRIKNNEISILIDKSIISTYNTTLDTDILSNNFYDFKIYAIPKSSSKEILTVCHYRHPHLHYHSHCLYRPLFSSED